MDAARTTPHESAPLHDGSPRALESTLQALGEAYEANVAAASADWSLPVAAPRRGVWARWLPDHARRSHGRRGARAL
jgi:hypothetical protein